MNFDPDVRAPGVGTAEAIVKFDDWVESKEQALAPLNDSVIKVEAVDGSETGGSALPRHAYPHSQDQQPRTQTATKAPPRIETKGCS